jgi:CCR4-NOT transcription complex subunit 3
MRWRGRGANGGAGEFKVIKLGIEEFDSIYDKLQASTNQSQKNKQEDELKRTIKKLQRSRDKVKGWASQNDIKDKKPLQEQRKLIESVSIPTPSCACRH